MISRLALCVLWSLFALTFADVGIGDNQVPKIGVLMRVAANWPGEQGLREGLGQHGYVVNLANPSGPPQLGPLHQAAKAMGMMLEVVDVHTAEEVHRALRSIPWRSIGGIVIGGDTIQLQEADEIAKAIQRARVPAVFPYREYHRFGALLSYGPNLQQVYERTAYYVDKILKGAKPAELPVEQWSRFEVIVDSRIARKMEIKVPKELLYRADEVLR